MELTRAKRKDGGGEEQRERKKKKKKRRPTKTRFAIYSTTHEHGWWASRVGGRHALLQLAHHRSSSPMRCIFYSVTLSTTFCFYIRPSFLGKKNPYCRRCLWNIGWLLWGSGASLAHKGPKDGEPIKKTRCVRVLHFLDEHFSCSSKSFIEFPSPSI